MKINEDLIIGEKSTTLGQVATDLENLKGYILYENETGTSETFTLNDSVENYKMVRIEAHENVNMYFSCPIVTNPNGKKVLLSCLWYQYLKLALLTFNDKTVTITKMGQFNLSEGTVDSKSNYVNVTRVVGYK
jgi:hypothetical protein